MSAAAPSAAARLEAGEKIHALAERASLGGIAVSLDDAERVVRDGGVGEIGSLHYRLKGCIDHTTEQHPTGAEELTAIYVEALAVVAVVWTAVAASRSQTVEAAVLLAMLAEVHPQCDADAMLHNPDRWWWGVEMILRRSLYSVAAWDQLPDFSGEGLGDAVKAELARYAAEYPERLAAERARRGEAGAAETASPGGSGR